MGREDQSEPRKGGLIVIEGWAKKSPDCSTGFGEHQLATLFHEYEVLHDDTVEDVPDWGWDRGNLVRFIARKR